MTLANLIQFVRDNQFALIGVGLIAILAFSSASNFWGGVAGTLATVAFFAFIGVMNRD